jgi:hypothetical protein
MAKGRGRLEEKCERVAATRGGESFFKETRVLVRETLPCAPQSPQKISPDAHQGNPVYDTGARVHKSYGLCAELRLQKKRTAARTRRANRRPR